MSCKDAVSRWSLGYFNPKKVEKCFERIEHWRFDDVVVIGWRSRVSTRTKMISSSSFYNALTPNAIQTAGAPRLVLGGTLVGCSKASNYEVRQVWHSP